jgi:L-serine/L-threonine ammonia-lyase
MIFSQTPIFESPAINARLQKKVYFKMDCHQPTRSFKIRGMAHLVQQKVAAGQRKFLASSGGNAGYSLAYACRRLGGSTHVVVPETSSARMCALIAGEGATVEIHGESWQEAHEYALGLAAEREAYYVSPFDDPLLWAGHATMMDECAKEISEPDMVVAAVGGGGLLCGIMEGMERNGWTKTTFLAAETNGAASFHRAIEAGEAVAIDSISTIATSLGAKQVAKAAFEWSKRRPVALHLCTDKEAMVGVKALMDAFNVLVEPACGAALSAVFVPTNSIVAANSILVIVCGGAALDSEGYYKYLQHYQLI